MSTLRTGTAGNDYFTRQGGAGNNPIGYEFGDTLAGGQGDDAYHIYFSNPVSSPPVVIAEAPGGGWDSITFDYRSFDYLSSADFALKQEYRLPNGVEEGAAGFHYAAVNNTVVGNALGNIISVRGHEDRLWRNEGYGGPGDDMLVGVLAQFGLHGEAGDDMLRVQLDMRPGWHFDAIVNGGGGTDTLVIDNQNANPGVFLSLAAVGVAQALPGGSQIAITGVENIWVSTSSSGADTLIGNGGANLLIGGGGDDSLSGGNGADSLFGDFPRDIGMLRDSYMDRRLALAGLYEIGGSSGSDTLNGGGGDDLLVGGSAGDLLSGGEGDDLLLGGYAPPDDSLTDRWISVEDYLFARQWNYAHGHFFWADGADTLNGGAGADTLDGGAGADRMAGGEGDDTYLVDDPGDRVIETAGEGYDTVLSGLAVTRLAAHVEALVLLDGAQRGFGNAEDNHITGNAGDNRLEGGEGADTLIGGAGNDTLVGGPGADLLVIAAPSDGMDRILGFVSGEDRIAISASGFGAGLTAGANLAGRFFPFPLPGGTPFGLFIHDAPTGRLWWDANGSLAGQRVLVALLEPGTALAASDLIVIA